MAISRNVAILQAFIIIACGIGVWKFTTGDEIAPLDQGLIQVTDSNGAMACDLAKSDEVGRRHGVA